MKLTIALRRRFLNLIADSQDGRPLEQIETAMDHPENRVMAEQTVNGARPTCERVNQLLGTILATSPTTEYLESNLRYAMGQLHLAWAVAVPEIAELEQMEKE